MVEDEFALLTEYNTVFVVDDSASMRGVRWMEVSAYTCKAGPCVLKLAQQTCEALSTLVEIAAKYDTDGIDLCFFNSSTVGINVKVWCLAVFQFRVILRQFSEQRSYLRLVSYRGPTCWP